MTTPISPAGLDQPGAGSHAAAAEAVREPLLDMDDIQGNILAGFNKDHQYLVALKFQAGLSNAEIGRVLAMSESNVGTKLHRTMEKLRRACNDRA